MCFNEKKTVQSCYTLFFFISCCIIKKRTMYVCISIKTRERERERKREREREREGGDIKQN